MVAPLVIGAALGLAKAAADSEKEKRQRVMESQIAKWSPWSKMKADPSAIDAADPFGSVLQGGLAGAMYGQANPEAPAAPEGSTGMTGAVPPMGESGANMGTPAGQAAMEERFPQYAQQNYYRPYAPQNTWSMVR